MTCPTYEHAHTKLNLNLRRGSLDISNLLAHPIAIAHLLQLIDNTQSLKSMLKQQKHSQES